MRGSWVCVKMCKQGAMMGAAGPVSRCVDKGLTCGQMGLYQDV